MDIAIRCSKSAFKFGVSEADIRMAFNNALIDERLINSDGKYETNERHLLVGYDQNSNLLDILYNVIDENTIEVVHSSPVISRGHEI
jgi:uncharacterized DUF497 family protein